MNKKIFFFGFIIISLLGIVLSILSLKTSILLEVIPNYQSFCNVNEVFNCDKVIKSPYGAVFGFPNSILGIIFYFVVILISVGGLVFASSNKIVSNLISVNTVLALIHFVLALALFLVSKIILNAFCLVCIGIYILAFLYLILCFAVKSQGNFITRFSEAAKASVSFFAILFGSNDKANELKDSANIPSSSGVTVGSYALTSLLLTIAVSLATFILPYKIWGKPLNKFTYEDVKAKDQKDLDAWRTADEHDFTIDFSNETAKANTKGEASALVRLVEFTDYECPACRVANPTVKEIKEKYGDKISLTIKQYPLDNACNNGITKKFHEHACNAAKVALCSKSQGKFFEVSEILYSLPEFTEENSVESASLALFKKLNEQGIDTAKISECLKNGEVDKLLESEIEEGNKAKLTGTPSLFINGSKVPALKKELIVKIIDYVLSSK